MYNLIHQAAVMDNEKWEIGNITLGYWYAPHFLLVINIKGREGSSRCKLYCRLGLGFP